MKTTSKGYDVDVIFGTEFLIVDRFIDDDGTTGLFRLYFTIEDLEGMLNKLKEANK